MLGRARGRRAAADPLHDGPQVRGRGAAAAADDVEPELVEEAGVRVGERFGREVVVRVTVDDRRQTRVGQAREERARVLRQVPEVLRHLGGTGRAVEPDHVGPERLERGERGADLRADEQPARRLDGDLHHDRDLDPGGRHRPAGTDDRRLALEEVLDRLDEQDVGAARQQPGDHRLVVVAQLGEGDLAERRETGAGADRPDHEAGSLGGGEVGRDLPGQSRGLLVDGEGLVGDAVLVQHQAEGAEGGGLDRVDAGLEVLGVHLPDEVGSGEDEALVAALERGATEVVGPETLVLHPGAERAVEHEDALGERGEELGHSPQGTGAPGGSSSGIATRCRGAPAARAARRGRHAPTARDHRSCPRRPTRTASRRRATLRTDAPSPGRARSLPTCDR